MNTEEVHAVHVAAYHDRRVAMPAHVRLALARAVALAREAGVRFEPNEVHCWAYRGRHDEPSVAFFKDRPVPIYLNITKPFTEREWVWIILHEFSHAYFDARDDIGVRQREARADRFADRALAGWR